MIGVLNEVKKLVIIFSIVNDRDIYRLDIFMRDNEGSGFSYIKGLGEWRKYIHFGYWVVTSEDALEVSAFNTV